jgi:hypothetical protein
MKDLLASYSKLRREFHNIERIQQKAIGLTEQDTKRLDKATVMTKQGFKLIKKVLKSHGIDTSKAKRE